MNGGKKGRIAYAHHNIKYGWWKKRAYAIRPYESAFIPPSLQLR